MIVNHDGQYENLAQKASLSRHHCGEKTWITSSLWRNWVLILRTKLALYPEMKYADIREEKGKEGQEWLSDKAQATWQVVTENNPTFTELLVWTGCLNRWWGVCRGQGCFWPTFFPPAGPQVSQPRCAWADNIPTASQTCCQMWGMKCSHLFSPKQWKSHTI